MDSDWEDLVRAERGAGAGNLEPFERWAERAQHRLLRDVFPAPSSGQEIMTMTRQEFLWDLEQAERSGYDAGFRNGLVRARAGARRTQFRLMIAAFAAAAVVALAILLAGR